MTKVPYIPPVAIGGIGGSGTRLVSQCLQKLDYFMGDDLNNSSDNLLFTFLFKRIEILNESEAAFNELLDIFLEVNFSRSDLQPRSLKVMQQLADISRPQHPRAWLTKRVKRAQTARKTASTNQPWGWKEPNTHIVLDRLLRYFPHMKYIHVVRNGLDMAYSNNQNQLKLWGDTFLKHKVEISARDSLQFWCKIHERVNRIGHMMGENFLLLNFDNFCSNPSDEVRKLCNFLDRDYEPSLIETISPPNSIGRFKSLDGSVFDSANIEFVKTLGFDTSFNLNTKVKRPKDV